MIGFGLVISVVGAWQFNRVFWQIERGNYRPNRLVMWVMTALILVLGMISIPLILWRHQAPRQALDDPNQPGALGRR
jgi:putative membrane protein